jgi:hypothetical protein
VQTASNQLVLTYYFGGRQTHVRDHIGDAEHAINQLRAAGIATTSGELERRGIDQGRERWEGHLMSGPEGRSYQVASRYCVGHRGNQWGPEAAHLYSEGDYSSVTLEGVAVAH